jgi:nitroreductase
MTEWNSERCDLLDESFPETDDIETQLRFLLRFAILAPSPRNSQPWAFAIRENQIHLFADLVRSQPVSDPERRELYISVGCALENLLVAAEHFGLDHGVSYFPQPSLPELVATVLLRPGGKLCEGRVGATLHAMVRRHNDPGVFRGTPVSQVVRRTLRSCLIEPDLELDLSSDELFRQWISALTMESDRIDFRNPAFRLELGHWMTQGIFHGPPPSFSGSTPPVSRASWGSVVADQDEARVESASVLGLIRATNDSHLTHVRVGQLFERVWLTATTLGLSINPLSATLRRPELRATLTEVLARPGWVPQHLFRIGYSGSRPVSQTPRRPLEDVLL